MDHSFNAEVAKEYDVNMAIFLQNMKFWTLNNLANKRNIHDGYCWTYNTIDAFCHIFPYWSKKQIRTIIDNCLENELIVKGNYNQTTYDRTCWYALTHKVYSIYPEIAQPVFIDSLYSSINKENAICPFGQMDRPQWANRFAPKGTPIPDTKPDTKPNTPITPLSPKGEGARFEEFWKVYPVKVAKSLCVKYWKKQKLDKKADEIMSSLQKQIKSDDKFLRGFVRNPSKYLREEGWCDEISKPKASLAIKSSKSEYDDNDTSWIDEMKL